VPTIISIHPLNKIFGDIPARSPLSAGPSPDRWRGGRGDFTHASVTLYLEEKNLTGRAMATYSKKRGIMEFWNDGRMGEGYFL
jgi:hypothetical protein